MVSRVAATGAIEFKLCQTANTASILKIQKGDITRWFVDASSDAIVLSLSLYYYSSYCYQRMYMFLARLYKYLSLITLRMRMGVNGHGNGNDMKFVMHPPGPILKT